MPSFLSNATITLSLDADDAVTFNGDARYTLSPTGGSQSSSTTTGQQTFGPYKVYATLVFVTTTAGSYTQASNPARSGRIFGTVSPSGVTTGLLDESGAAVAVGGVEFALLARADLVRYQSTSLVLITQGNDGFPPQIRYAEPSRGRLILRNPTGSLGSLQMGYSNDPRNIINPNPPATWITVNAGQELIDCFSKGQWYCRYNGLTSAVPASLFLEIEAEGGL